VHIISLIPVYSFEIVCKGTKKEGVKGVKGVKGS
jgi:hypothetical protein